jgi:peptide/nickel transport system permease protein
MGRLQYVVRRVVQLCVTILAVSTILFGLFRLMPGDPTTLIVSPGMDSSVRQRLIEDYGLNDPLSVQYLRYIENILTLDFGRSFHTNAQVIDVIATRLPNTLVLMFSALFVAYSVGVTLGVLSAWYRDSSYETGVVVTALVGRSVPSFWTGLIILWIGGAWLNVIPLSGMASIGESGGFWDTTLSFDFLRHLVGPASVLAFYYMGYPLLIMRNSMLEVLSEDFINLCRAKGLRDRTIMFKHAARNALLPVLTAAAVAVGFAVGGSVLVETVFGWPGLGREMVQAVVRRDYPVAQGTFIVLASTVILMNFVADLLYGVLDPRVAYD